MAAIKDPMSQAPRRIDSFCEACNLHKRSLTVCCESEGPDDAKIMLVGEALGVEEDKLGRPFVGDAGRKLAYLLNRAGVKRTDLYLTNCIKCHPQANKKPVKKEIVACTPYLLYEILQLKPKVILTLGATATGTVAGPAKSNLKKRRGFPKRKVFEWISSKGKRFSHECWVIPTMHPSAALRGGGWVLDDLIVHDIKLAASYAEDDIVLTMPATKVHVVKEGDLEGALELIRMLKARGRYVLDLETSGLRPHEHEILCIGFCIKAGEAHVLPMLQQNCAPYWTPSQRRQIADALADLFESTEMWGQNIKFDIKFLRKLTGIIDFNVTFDTMAAHHCIDENKLHNLTFQCQWFLRWDRYDEAMEQYEKGGEPKYELAPNQVIWKYLGHDVNGTYQLRMLHKEVLKAEKLVTAFKTELSLTEPLADTEFRGIRVDKAWMQELVMKYQKQAGEALIWLRDQMIATHGEDVGKKFNPNSHQQLSKWLVEIGAALEKKTKGGGISTDKNVLAALALQEGYVGEVASTVQDLREANKRLSTYLDGSSIEGGKEGLVFKSEIKGFLRHVQAHDRIHASYNTSLTVTARLSANDPPIQTIPRKGGLRSMFIPDNEDCLLLSCDYAKVELCVMAWLANDAVMVEELLRGVDLHAMMAIAVRLNRNPTYEEFEEMLPICEKEDGWENERAVAKGVNFGIPYGRTAKGIVEANPDAFPDTMDEHRRIKTVQEMMDAYFDKYVGVAEYIDRQIATAHRRGSLRTLFTGRKRRLTGIDWFFSPYAQKCRYREHDLEQLNREAQNYQIQSTASEELSRATRRVYDGLKTASIPCLRILMTLHDQLLFNVHKDHTERAIAYIKGWMESVLYKDEKHIYEVPLNIDVKVQKRWGVGLTGESEY